jgi:Carboxypeptidase regulatory-like domain/TonB dependent receptor
MKMEEVRMSILRNVRLAGALLSVLAVLALCVMAPAAHAQSVATVLGTVTDATGAAVPGASITLVDTRTNTPYYAKTSSDGAYRIPDVAPGPGYSLSVKKDGFQVFVVNSLYLPVATATTQDIKLELGTVSSKVEITAEGSISLDTTDTAIGNNLDMHAIANLPNEFRDNPGNLLRLEVGVVSAQTPNGAPTTGIGAVDPNQTRDGAVAGARADQNNIVVDGIDATDFAFGTAFAIESSIPVDAIQEFNTQVANPSVQYGGRGGAQTIITTKGGSNTWHGDAYEYNRNAATEANDFFNQQAGVPRTALIRNQFGGNVGGPAWRDKVFFFFEYDGRRDKSQASSSEIVPFPHVDLGELAYINNSGGGTCDPRSRLTSADVSTGCVTILTAAQVTALDPCSNPGNNCAVNTQGFQAAGLDPTLTALFKSRYPAPNNFNLGDGVNTAGFQFNVPDPFTENGYLARTDFNLNSKNKLFARFNFRNVTAVAAFNQFPGDPLTAPQVIQDRSWALGETWTATPNFINQFTYGETRENHAEPITFNPEGPLYELTFDSAQVSNPYVRQSQFSTVAPVPTFRDDATWIHGRHTFTFGGEWEPTVIRDGLTNDLTFIQQGLGGNLAAGLNSTLRPADILNNSRVTSLWDGAFVGGLGSINNLQAAFNYNGKGDPLDQGSPVRHDYRINETAGYFQDTYKLRPDLTVTAGVRYQYQMVPYEIHGVQASVLNTDFQSIIADRVANGLAGIADPDSTPLLTYQLTGKANHAPGLYQPDHHDFAPRLGLAWNPSFRDGILGRVLGDRKTVFRAGAGMIWDENVINSVVQLEDQDDYTFGNTDAEVFGSSTATQAENLVLMPRFNSINSVPFPVTAPDFESPVTPSFAVFNGAVDRHLKTPYEYTASFGIQRELPGGFQVEADYYGRFNRHLFVLADAGQLVDFTDPASKQTLSGAFTVLERAAQASKPATSVPDQPFFENQMNAALAAFGLGSCASFFGESCTQEVYLNNGTGSDGITGSPSSQLGQGDTAFTWFSQPFLPNVGFTSQFDVNTMNTSVGSSSYNALLMTVRKRLTHGLQFDVNYTFSHSIDNNSDTANQNGNFQPGVTAIVCDATNPKECRGNSEFDAKHQITADFVYDLPFGRGKMFAHNINWALDEAIGGWQISGIETWRTGLALTADSGIASTTSLAADPGEIFVGPRSALQTDVHLQSDGTVQLYKNPTAAIAAFTPPVGVEIGTRDNLRGPHFSNFDVAVNKNFPLASERYKLQFRAEAYNVFNHTNFGLPDPTLNGNFGQLTSEAGVEPSRVMQFALRFEF